MSEEDIYIGETSIQIGQHGFINQPKEIIDYIKCLQNQLQQKENIIKEVREYIENNTYFEGNAVKTMIYQDYSKGILEILDELKGSDKE